MHQYQRPDDDLEVDTTRTSLDGTSLRVVAKKISGLVRGIQFIPTLLISPLAGTAADRYSRKTLLLVAQTIQGLSFAVLALLILSRHIEPWHVYVTAVVAGVMQAIQQELIRCIG